MALELADVLFRGIPIVGTGIAIPILLSNNKQLLKRFLAFYGGIVLLYIATFIWPPKYDVGIGFASVTWAFFALLIFAMIYYKVKGKEPHLIRRKE